MRQTRGSQTDTKLHEDGHSVTSISDIVNIYVGSHERNVKTMIVNSSNSLSRRESGERANVMFIFGHHTEQQVHKIKSKCYLNLLHFQKKMLSR